MLKPSAYESLKAAVTAAVSRKKPNGAGWYAIKCPACGAPGRTMAVAANSGRFYCWRKKCGVDGFCDIDFDVAPQPLIPKAHAFVQAEWPENYVSLADVAQRDANLAAQLHAYIRFRNVTWERAVTAGFGFVPYNSWFKGPRLVIPVHFNGIRVGWNARDLTDKIPPKYLNAPGFPRDHIVYNAEALYRDTDLPVMVMEGALDVEPHLPDATGCFGKPTEAQLDILETTTRPIVCVLDPDAVDESWATSRALRLRGKTAAHLPLRGTRDPNNIPPAELMRAAIDALKHDL